MTGTREYAVTQQTDQTQQATRITLPLARLRWLQEMGIAPALLRPYAPQTPAEARPAEKRTASPEAPLHAPEKDTVSDSGRAQFKELLRALDGDSAPRRAPRPNEQKAEPVVPAPPVNSGEQKTFTEWQQSLLDCNACARCDERAVVLPGIGVQEQPDWFVLGGMPTRQDEGAGRAWSASAGRLLAMQLRSMGLNLREQVYLSYALKCRSNQPQASTESITACRQVFLQELAWVQPKRLLVLGPEAVQMLWGAEARLDELRGELQQWTDPDGRALPVVVTVDPTSLLLRPQQKARAWRDLLVLQQLMAAPAAD
ncbi:MAG TPA: uracil-DNA glycosylase [Paenalcaligenes sp.]|nr:uracil-DNA glycosylase [Paenalcaligenes sp.]